MLSIKVNHFSDILLFIENKFKFKKNTTNSSDSKTISWMEINKLKFKTNFELIQPTNFELCP